MQGWSGECAARSKGIKPRRLAEKRKRWSRTRELQERQREEGEVGRTQGKTRFINQTKSGHGSGSGGGKRKGRQHHCKKCDAENMCDFVPGGKFWGAAVAELV
eukprot:365428-Chlamydomonas_euryale.AAC.21